jgi:ATP-dependent RNA helicase DDX23/PRP28
MSTEETQPKEKKVPVSLEELLAKKEEEKQAANRVCTRDFVLNVTINDANIIPEQPTFLTKEERAKLALERRQKEVAEQRDRRMKDAQHKMEFDQKAEDEARRMEEASRYSSNNSRNDRRYNRDDRDRGGRRRDTRRRERSVSSDELEIPEGLTEKEKEAIKVRRTLHLLLSYNRTFLFNSTSSLRHDIWERKRKSAKSGE